MALRLKASETEKLEVRRRQTRYAVALSVSHGREGHHRQ